MVVGEANRTAILRTAAGKEVKLSDHNHKRNQIENEGRTVDVLFDEYRRSGIALMTTVVGLSSGGFIGLFQMETTRQIASLYLIPIAIALSQQLTFYLGSRSRAISKYSQILSSTADPISVCESMNYGIDAGISRMYSHYYFGMSDTFCGAAVLALGLATVWPIVEFTSALICILLSLSVGVFFSCWQYRRFKLKREIKNTEWS